jgi:hypothetical protein
MTNNPIEETVAVKQAHVLSPEEQAALEPTVRFTNERVEQAGIACVEIGQHLLVKFFNGDIIEVRKRSPHKLLSLPRLAEHPNLNMSFAGVSQSIALAVQDVQLATAGAPQQLTVTNKVLLLRVVELQAKKKYIGKLQKNKLSSRTFRELLVKEG